MNATTTTLDAFSARQLVAHLVENYDLLCILQKIESETCNKAEAAELKGGIWIKTAKYWDACREAVLDAEAEVVEARKNLN